MKLNNLILLLFITFIIIYSFCKYENFNSRPSKCFDCERQLGYRGSSTKCFSCMKQIGNKGGNTKCFSCEKKTNIKPKRTCIMCERNEIINIV